MPIPTQQLETWGTQPSATRSATTYDALRSALTANGSLRKYTYDPYLQGSYANQTNIRGDSDVDVVLELTSSYRPVTTSLTTAERERFERSSTDADHGVSQFKADVLAGLRQRFGAGNVTEGKKCIKIKGTDSRLPLDVLVAQHYRWYFSYPEFGAPSTADGIVFWTTDGRMVVNWPKQHRENGVTKHRATGDRYKQVVRIVKNARRVLAEQGALGRDVAPSYFVECLLYNVPNASFTGNVSTTYLGVLQALHNMRNNLVGLKCQSENTDLFGPAPEQWDVPRAQQLIAALIAQWNDWS